MLKEKLEELGWKLLGSRAADPGKEVEALERSIGVQLPATYRTMLIDYGGEIFFGNGAIFLPKEPTPWDDTGDGTLDIIDFYGVGDFHTTLQSMINDLVGEQIPEWLIPIGDSTFGNQLCLAITGEERDAVYFWDHEHDEGTGLYRVAPSFDAFIAMLKPDPEAHTPIEIETTDTPI